MQMKRILNAIKSVVVGLIVVLAVFMMVFTIISVSTFNRNDRNIFGYRAYIVASNSMQSSNINAGDLILVKEADPYSLEAGDIITFISQDPNSFGEIVTHMIREKTVDDQGYLGFVTYGTTTGVDDATIVSHMYILGKYEAKIPYAGTFFNFLKTPQGYIVCILIPFMLLIIYQGINCVRTFRRYKGEQVEQMNAEKARIEAERAENARMMEELLALKAQLEKQSAPSGGGEDANA